MKKDPLRDYYLAPDNTIRTPEQARAEKDKYFPSKFWPNALQPSLVKWRKKMQQELLLEHAAIFKRIAISRYGEDFKLKKVVK